MPNAPGVENVTESQTPNVWGLEEAEFARVVWGSFEPWTGLENNDA